jgi:hypothetical protein
MWRRELLGLCFEKWRRPALRIIAADTLGGAMAEQPREAWSLRHVVERLGASIVRVELPNVGTAQPASLSAAA